MICAACGLTTSNRPCSECGKPPLLQGRYRLEEVVGDGGVGTTYRAVRVEDDHTLAVKELRLRRTSDDKAVELFHREAAVLRELDHAGIPAYHDDFVAGRGKNRALYIVQEFVEGPSLAQEMQSHRYTEEEVKDIAREVLSILGYIHALSPPVVHRDVKPGNVMRRGDGRLVLVDFGSVRDLIKGELGGSTVAGTFGYMAPEQFQGDAAPATDLYALGALMVTLLGRVAPHALLDGAGNLAWRPVCKVSASTARALDALLARDPADRPGSASEAAALLDVGAPPGSAPPTRSTAPAPGPAPRVTLKEATRGTPLDDVDVPQLPGRPGAAGMTPRRFGIAVPLLLLSGAGFVLVAALVATLVGGAFVVSSSPEAPPTPPVAGPESDALTAWRVPLDPPEVEGYPFEPALVVTKQFAAPYPEGVTGTGRCLMAVAMQPDGRPADISAYPRGDYCGDMLVEAAKTAHRFRVEPFTPIDGADGAALLVEFRWTEEGQPSEVWFPSPNALPAPLSQTVPVPLEPTLPAHFDASAYPVSEELSVARRVAPRYPADATGEVRCAYDVAVGPDGTPVAVKPAADCPTPFSRAGRAVLEQWRWDAFTPSDGATGTSVGIKLRWLDRPSESDLAPVEGP